MPVLRALPLLLLSVPLLAQAPAASDAPPPQLWQERFLWDGLLQARDRAARVSADPALLKVVELIAHQAAQQAVNLEQIHAYAHAQIENLEFAFSEPDPSPSLAVIQGNFVTLAQGAEQIRNNLYYLTSRIRMCGSQALPDPKLTEKATLLIAQIQTSQLKLNDLYTATARVDEKVQGETWYADEFLRYNSSNLLRAVVEVQDSVFSVYNASYELYLLSKEE